MYTPRSDIYRYIVSIDIGIHHLALVLVETHPDYTVHDIVWFELVDITRFVHLDAATRWSCTLPHSRTVCDWLSHVFHLYHELFDLADHILIERQPPGGQIAVEQLFFFQYRSKATLVHPNAVHAFFGWHGHRDEEDAETRYHRRKEKSLHILHYRLTQTNRSWLVDELRAYTRQHDIADAYCQVVYFAYHMHLDARRRQAPDPNDPWERFRFKLELGV